MQIGFTFPQYEIGADPAEVRALAQAAEEMGYRHLVAYDHVLGAEPAHYPDVRFVYTYRTMFHEPFVLFGYLAGLTKRLQFLTGILILPQRQTALVAKQAAEVDVLSGGRLELGVAIGWNPVEYTALGMNFHTRGKLLEEQIQVLRLLWTQEIVTFKGRWHNIDHAGINPLPVQRPIPLWIGGYSEAIIDRAARLADGLMGPDPQKVRERAKVLGRDVSHLRVRGGVRLPKFDFATAGEQVRLGEAAGVTHFTVNGLDAGYKGAEQHIAALRRFKEAARKEWR